MRMCSLVEEDRLSYAQGLNLQAEWLNRVEKGEAAGALLLMQHSNVITMGRSALANDIHLSQEEFAARDIEVYPTNRGGSVTFHGPGQLIGYPVLNLRLWQKDVHWYVSSLEQVIIDTLQDFGVEAGRKRAYTGVWVGDKKIAAIGVRIKNWITLHGFSFIITKESIHNFKLINPCGITEFGVMALEEAVPAVNFVEVASRVKENFGHIFDCALHFPFGLEAEVRKTK